MTEDALDAELSRPTPALVEAFRRLDGDLVVLGAGGKMGPTLVRLAQRASADAGSERRITAVARFSDPRARRAIESVGGRALEADLLEPDVVAALPDAPNVVFMAGQKFGTDHDGGRTWAINAFLPGLVAHRYRSARIVVFSTGNVYPLVPVAGAGARETDPPGPVGEYAQSALARERIFQHAAGHYGTRVAILRINYAIEPRYGVLRDVADRVRAGRPVDLTTGWVNVIWQRDANAIALRALEDAAAPPFVVNVTGRPAVRVRDLALAFGHRWNVEPVFSGVEADTALLADAAKAEAIFGPNPVGVTEMIDRVATWIEAGGRSLDKPTHFERRDGRF
ncbi:MAG: NAD-dependent epimerase/dehydratase family protein [Gemmatimonadales bacterium]